MVNLFEQWNDMDFASTYEPIDWKALNDFANRARQDAKDNADMVNEAKKSMLNVVSDPNAYVTEEGNKLVNQSLTDLSGIDLNASPADVAKKTSGMVNTAKGITDAINKNAEIRRKSLENMSYSQDDLQLVDAYLNNQKPLTDSGYNSYTYSYAANYDNALNQRLAQAEKDKAEYSHNGNGIGVEGISPQKMLKSAKGDTTGWRNGKKEHLLFRLADIAIHGDKSEWYNRYKEALEFDANGNIIKQGGIAKVRDDFSGFSDDKHLMYESDITPTGIKFKKDKQGNMIPIDIGRGFDAFVTSDMWRDTRPKWSTRGDATSVRPPKDGGGGDINDDNKMAGVTWKQGAIINNIGSSNIEFTKDGTMTIKKPDIPMPPSLEMSEDDWGNLSSAQQMKMVIADSNKGASTTKIEDEFQMDVMTGTGSTQISGEFKDYDFLGNLHELTEYEKNLLKTNGLTEKIKGRIDEFDQGVKLLSLASPVISTEQEKLGNYSDGMYVCGPDGDGNSDHIQPETTAGTANLALEFLKTNKLLKYSFATKNALLNAKIDQTNNVPFSVECVSYVRKGDLVKALDYAEEHGGKGTGRKANGTKKWHLTQDMARALGLEFTKDGKIGTAKIKNPDNKVEEYYAIKFKVPRNGEDYTIRMMDEAAGSTTNKVGATQTISNVNNAVLSVNPSTAKEAAR